MKVDPAKRIGGGRTRQIQIMDGGKLRTVRARGGLFGGDLFVIMEGRHRHKIAIPNWDNMIARAALQSGRYQSGYYDPSWLTYRVYASVYEALRYTYYVLDQQYGVTFRHGEKGRLQLAREELLELNEIAAGLRTGNAEVLSLDFFKKTRAILEQIEERPRDTDKRAARTMSASLVSVYDSLGRTNATVKMVRALAAANRLKHRQVSIACIEPVIIARRQTLKSLIEEMELFWEGLYEYLDRLFVQKYWERGQSRCMQLLNDDTRRPQLLQHLILFQQEIGRYDLEPFTKTSYHVYEELRTVITHIRATRYGAARKLLERIWQSLKLRHIRAEIETALIPFTCSLFGEQVDPQACDQMIYVAKWARRALGQVDESQFEHPVTRHVRGQLSAAIDLLIQKTHPEAMKAKEHIKQAVTIL